MLTALADYEVARPRLLPEQFSDYRVESRRRGCRHPRALAVRRDVQAGPRAVDVGRPAGPGQLVESDANSSMVTTWTRASRPTPGSPRSACAPPGTAPAASAGFFERTFAPRGLRRVYDEILDRLDRELTAG